MRGLALEGGGARGAYHIGVVKALVENGYEFDGFVGTSIGAVNAAVLAQGDFETALEVWRNISMEQLFDLEEQHLMRLGDAKLDMSLSSNVKKSLKKIIKGRGVDTSRMRAFLERYISEERIRRSGKDFGLVAISVSERIPYEIFLEHIPQGMLLRYIMASASFPGFKPEVIDENKFLDGGLYNNCPVNLLNDKSYDEIIAIRTGAPGVFRKIECYDHVKVISPSENLGNMLLFTRERSEASIRLGYLDGLRAVKNLRGRSYYLQPVDLRDFYMRLLNLPDDAIQAVGKALDLPDMPGMRMLFEEIVPRLSSYLRLADGFDYADFVIALLEHAAKQRELDRYQIYDYDRFFSLIKKTPAPEKKRSGLLAASTISFLGKKAAAVELLAAALLSDGQAE